MNELPDSIVNILLAIPAPVVWTVLAVSVFALLGMAADSILALFRNDKEDDL